MGARQSKRSVDITTTPKKGEAEGSPVNEDKIEKLGDADVVEVVTNGTTAHTDIEFVDKDDVKEAEEKTANEVKENGVTETSDGEKSADKDESAPAAGDQAAKPAETTADKNGESNEKAAETPDAKKQKEKKKKKWSLRSISFSKKDKSKPSKDKEKNGEVEEVNEEKEEENTTTPATEAAKPEDIKTPVEEAPTEVNNAAQPEEPQSKAAEIEEPSEKEKIEEVEAPEPEPEQNKVEAEKEKEPIEEVKPEVVVAEPENPSPIVDEPTTVPSVVEEVKEVRNEEVPPPLPNSNPPSQVAVFAESLISENATEINECLPQESQVVEQTEKPVETIESVVVEAESVEVAVEKVVEDSESSPPLEIVEHAETPIVEPENEEVSVEKVTEDSELTPPVEIAENIPNVEPKVEESVTSLTRNKSDLEHLVELSSAGDSSPLIVEALSKSDENAVPEVPSQDSVTFSLNLSDEPSVTSNLAEADLPEVPSLEFERIPLQVEDLESESTTSAPVIIEEKIPIVSSAGDVPNPVSSDISLGSLQECKSDLDLKESQQSNLYSEDPSLDLSTIPESVESGEVKSEETKKEAAEPLCNADSLADLSTESLPSLPEPTDSVLEPMSLPPLDYVPDPLVDDSVCVKEPTAESQVVEVVAPMTNGKTTNGTSDGADDDDSPLSPPLDGPLKQVIVSETPVTACEISQSNDETTVTAETVESQDQ